MTDQTRTELVNLALREIGTTRISDWTQASPEAEVARDVWSQAVRKALSRHEWDFAITSRKLAKSGATPVTRYRYIYTVPENFVRVSAVSEYATMEPPLWSYHMRADGLHTDAEHVYLDYVYYENDEAPAIGTWPPWFTSVLVADLASMMASPLKSTTERERLEQLAQDRLRTGRTIQSQQSPPRRWPDGSWISAHRGYRVR